MPANRPRPDTAEAWLEHARSDLKIAQASVPDVYLEDLCYHTQQCAEKALKALLVLHKIKFPFTHDLSELITLNEKSGLLIPEDIKNVATLTPYAVGSRYPGFDEPVNESEYKEAIDSAEKILKWAESSIRQFRIEEQAKFQKENESSGVLLKSTPPPAVATDSTPDPV
jgi:HEPN domain-containing protein